MSVKSRLNEFKERITSDLDQCVYFWLSHSHDEQHGGFFNCLGKDGEVYDETKYGWLQGRQVWTYARLYNESERFKTDVILDAAEKGAEFIMKNLRPADSYKCCFSMTRDGRPTKIQRTIFAECFYVMAMAEMARATGKSKYKTEAINMFDVIIYWVTTDSSGLGRPKLTGNMPTNTLAVPMMMLCVLDVMEELDSALGAAYADMRKWCVTQVLAHVQRNGSRILENVSLDGKEIPGSEGRKMSPGHAIEGGWFLLNLAKKTNDDELKQKAIKHFIVGPFEYGWDAEFGGLYNFMDSDNKPSTHPEWNMKLWWPHNEAMIAYLMAYEETGDEAHLDKFAQIFDYSMKHFSDPENGEWYGYLSRQGGVSLDFKGGPFKGCFHVPRCLLMCEQILTRLIQQK